MAFYGTGAPRQCEAGGDGGEVSFEAVGEGVEAGQVVDANRLDPLRELVVLELGEHLPERVDVPGEGSQFGSGAAVRVTTPGSGYPLVLERIRCG
ncbi:hypothetical protein ACFC96_43965 [Streptomyces sp. NPDC055955]|uniref:hypothetical protein n=1 Tax=Streptomyces sp. NPDC055955 TaxID=3345665 RepID=UPI0035E36266